MLAKHDFVTFVGKVVADVAPSEQTAFAVAAPQLADALYSGEGLNAEIDQRRTSEFQFLDSATHVLQFVGLMVGTFQAIQQLRKSLKPSQGSAFQQKLEAEWISELQKSGLTEAKAAEIARRFSADLTAEMNRS